MANRAHQPCPYEECSSSDAFSWEENEQVGKCHSCSRSYPMAGMTTMKIFDWAKEDYPLKQRKENIMNREIVSGTYEGISYTVSNYKWMLIIVQYDTLSSGLTMLSIAAMMKRNSG